MINSSGCRQQRVLSAASKIFSTSSTIIWQHSYNDAIAVCNTVIAVNEYRQEAVWWIWLSVKNWSRTAAAAHGGPSQAGLGDFLHGNARHTPPVRSPLVICSFRHGRAGTRWQLATGNWQLARTRPSAFVFAAWWFLPLPASRQLAPAAKAKK